MNSYDQVQDQYLEVNFEDQVQILWEDKEDKA